MLKFTQKKPHPALRSHIRSYWLIQSDGSEQSLNLLVPDGYPELFFVLNESLIMPQFSDKKTWAEHTEGGLIGQASTSFAFQPAPFSKMLFVKLYPWTPQQLFGIPSWELTDLAIDLGAATVHGAHT